MLKRNLDKKGIEYDLRNIWENPDDAAFVRSVANGNETVPTVVIGGTVSLVNPSVGDIELAMEAG
jgi:mycoredoxin